MPSFPSIHAMALVGTLAAFAAAEPVTPRAAAGLKLLDHVNVAFKLDGEYAGLYAEAFDRGALKPAPVWPMSMTLDAKLAAAKVDPTRLPSAIAFARALDRYRLHKVNGHLAYIAEFHQSSAHFYDDNAWLAIGFLEAYAMSNDADFLDRAKETLAFVLSGEDKTHGGIVWEHEKPDTRNACCTGPAMVACLRLYAVTKDPAMLEAAHRLRDWNNRVLRDNADGLYEDHSRVRHDGTERVSGPKWSYNSALPLIADVELYRLTQDKTYLDDARRIAQAGIARWHDQATGAIKDDAQFARWWIEALDELHQVDPDPQWKTAITNAADWVIRNDPGADFYPKRFEDPKSVKKHDAKLNDQSSRVRILLIAGKP